MTVAATAKKEHKKHASEKAVVYAAARRHGIPGWLLWGVYGAENSWNYSNGVPFGLIEGSYNGRVFHNSGLPEAADLAAEVLARLKKERGSLSAAVTAYSGGDYNINHPKELARSNHSNGNIIPVDLHLGLPFGGPHATVPLPGPDINPLNPGEGLQKDLFGGIFGLGEGALGGIGSAEIPVLSPIADSLKNIAAFFRGLGELLLTPQGWLRIAKIGGGAILFLWGLKIFIRNSTGVDVAKQGSKVKSTVAKAVDAAAVVATVK